MKWIDKIGKYAVLVACVGIAAPRMSHAGAPAPRQAPAVKVRDVALQPGGVLRGMVVDAQGAAKADTAVKVLRDGELVSATTTDAEGKFYASNLTGGVYQVVTDQGGVVYRAWAPNTAPPAAQPGALIVSDQNVTRGNFHGKSLIANPWVIGGAIAAAIAIPLALADDDDDEGS